MMKRAQFLGTEKVERNRIRIERIKNVLEAQYSRAKNTLERGLRTQVSEAAHLRKIKKSGIGLSSTSALKGRNSFNNQAKLIGHRQG